MRVPSTGWNFFMVTSDDLQAITNLCLFAQTLYHYFSHLFEGTWCPDRRFNRLISAETTSKYCNNQLDSTWNFIVVLVFALHFSVGKASTMCFSPIMKTTSHFMLRIEFHRLKLHGWGPLKEQRACTLTSSDIVWAMIAGTYLTWHNHVQLSIWFSLFTSLLNWLLYMLVYWKSPCFTTSAARMYTRCNPYSHGSSAVTMSGEVNKNLFGSPGCE